MLDDENGYPGLVDRLPEVVEDLQRKRAGDPRHGLVEQQEPGVAHHRAAYIHKLALAARELAGQVFRHVGHLKLVEHGVGLS